MAKDKEMNLDEFNRTLKDMRELVESKTAASAEAKAKAEKMDAFLDSQEDINQQNLKDSLKREAAEQELKNEILTLQKMVLEPRAGKGEVQIAAEIKSFENYAKLGPSMLAQVDHEILQEAKLLRTSDNTQGGYLVPNEKIPEIIKEITEFSPIRTLARIRLTNRNEVEIPKRDSLLAANWVGEADQDAKSNSGYGLEKIPVHKIQVTVDTTHEILQDAAFNIENEIFGDVAEEIGRLEGLAFVKGVGNTTQPQGLFTNADIPLFASGDANLITADSIIEIAGEVKTGYNLSYIFNRRTTAKIRTLKGSDNNYLFVPGLADGTPNTLNGLRFTEVIDIDDVGTNTFPLMIGDYRMGYTIVDNQNIQMIRDDLTQKRNGKIEFTFFKRVGAQVVLAEAFVKMKIANSV